MFRKVYYLGTFPEEDFYVDFMRDAADQSGLHNFPGLPEGVQISIRANESTRYLFLMNLTRKQQTVQLHRTYRSLFDDRNIDQALTMDPYAVEIVELPHKNA